MFSRTSRLALAFSTMSLVACGTDVIDSTDDSALEDGKEDYLKKCGGIAGLHCPKGYTCKLDATYPDAMGKCVKLSTLTCANVKCAAGTHCEMKGINGATVPACINDDTQSCANVKCAAGTHCEMKGINGGAIPVCIQDQFCGGIAGLKCAAGQKCLLDGNYPDAGGKCVDENFCNTTADCASLIHPMCVGDWQCLSNSCAWHCGI